MIIKLKYGIYAKEPDSTWIPWDSRTIIESYPRDSRNTRGIKIFEKVDKKSLISDNSPNRNDNYSDIDEVS